MACTNPKVANLESINIQQLLDNVIENKDKFVDSIEDLMIVVKSVGVQKKLSDWVTIEIELHNSEQTVEVVSCAFCGEEKEGSITDCGKFLMEHKEFHHYKRFISEQADFLGDGDELETNNSDSEDVEDE